MENWIRNFLWITIFILRISVINFGDTIDFGVLHKRPLHKGPHQNQAIAQKLGILGEKVTSMTGLRIEKYLLGPI